MEECFVSNISLDMITCVWLVDCSSRIIILLLLYSRIDLSVACWLAVGPLSADSQFGQLFFKITLFSLTIPTIPENATLHFDVELLEIIG